jgi:hypothetical protein
MVPKVPDCQPIDATVSDICKERPGSQMFPRFLLGILDRRKGKG